MNSLKRTQFSLLILSQSCLFLPAHQQACNGSEIEWTPQGVVIAGDTRNNLNLGGIQLQATSAYNQVVDADSYVAMIDEQGNWQWV